MSPNDRFPEPLSVVEDGGHLFVPVAWRHAEGLQTFLRGQGFPSTLHLDPGSREARLEMWEGTDRSQLEAVLGLAHDPQPTPPLRPAA
jgi:hypothetical protein